MRQKKEDSLVIS